MITEIRYLDCCLSDYFQGYAGVTLAVPVWAGMTYGELRQEIEDDSNAADYGIDDWSGFDAALAELFDSVKPGDAADIAANLEPEPEDYDGESVYAYFGIVQD
jgi:hypothetical protein